MDKKTFNLIMDSLSDRIKKCEKAFKDINSTEDLLKLKLSDLIKFKEFCKTEISDMTKIIMVDFYHIIGMGDLTPPQMTKFTFAMRNYLNYRSDIKNIASNLNDISKLPKLPTKSKFKLLALCDLTLTKNVRPDEEDEVEFEDLDTVGTFSKVTAQEKEAKANNKIFTLKGTKITVPKDKLEEFFGQFAPTQAYYSHFKTKVDKGKTALGIDWCVPTSEDKNYTGTVKASIRDELRKKFNL